MKNWLKILLVVLIFAVISVSIYLILKAFNIDSIDTLKSIIQNAGQLSILVYFLIFTTSLILLCFVPLLATTITCLGIYIFNPLTAFVVCMISNLVATSILFLIGDKFGEGIARKLIGRKNFDDAQNLVDSKSKVLLPILYFIPCVPDEALALIAGMTKIKYWYLITVSLIYHAVELGLFFFLGSNLIDWKNLRIIDWIFILNFLIVDYFLIKKLENKLKNNDKNNNNE